MSKTKKALTTQLVAAVEPHLGTDTLTNLPPKAVAKTLRKLAKHVLKQPAKATKATKATKNKAAAVPAPPAAKHARKALASELTAALQPYLSTPDSAAEAPSKAITKTIKRLAAAVAKQRRKQSKQAAKADWTVGAVATGTELPAPAAPPKATRATSPATARRPAAKQPAPKAAPAAPATNTVTEK